MSSLWRSLRPVRVTGEVREMQLSLGTCSSCPSMLTPHPPQPTSSTSALQVREHTKTHIRYECLCDDTPLTILIYSNFPQTSDWTPEPIDEDRTGQKVFTFQNTKMSHNGFHKDRSTSTHAHTHTQSDLFIPTVPNYQKARTSH